MEEKNILELTEEETNVLKEYQKVIDNEKINLGNLRLQFLISERSFISRIEKAQEDFYSHLKKLSQIKNIPTTGEWFFDPITYVFKKRT